MINPHRIHSKIPIGEMFKKELEALERAIKIMEERSINGDRRQ